MAAVSPLAVFLKDPGSLLDYGIDWSEWLLPGDTLTGSTWSVPAGLTLVSSSYASNVAMLFIQGGTVNTTYDVMNEIMTTGGRRDQRTIRIMVVDR